MRGFRKFSAKIMESVNAVTVATVVDFDPEGGEGETGDRGEDEGKDQALEKRWVYCFLFVVVLFLFCFEVIKRVAFIFGFRCSRCFLCCFLLLLVSVWCFPDFDCVSTAFGDLTCGLCAVCVIGVVSPASGWVS